MKYSTEELAMTVSQVAVGPIRGAAPLSIRGGDSLRAQAQHHEVPLCMAISLRGLHTLAPHQVRF